MQKENLRGEIDSGSVTLGGAIAVAGTAGDLTLGQLLDDTVGLSLQLFFFDGRVPPGL